jgi:hypothetical protein
MEKSYYLFLNRVNKYYNEISILNQPILVSYNKDIENEKQDCEYIKSKLNSLRVIMNKKTEKDEKLLTFKNKNIKNKVYKINIE